MSRRLLAGANTAALLLAAASLPGSGPMLDLEDTPKPTEPKLPSDSTIRHEHRVANRMSANKGCEKNSVETRVTRRNMFRKAAEAKAPLMLKDGKFKREPRRNRRKIVRAIAKGLQNAASHGQHGDGPRWMRRAKNARPTEGNE